MVAALCGPGVFYFLGKVVFIFTNKHNLYPSAKTRNSSVIGENIDKVCICIFEVLGRVNISGHWRP